MENQNTVEPIDQDGSASFKMESDTKETMSRKKRARAEYHHALANSTGRTSHRRDSSKQEGKKEDRKRLRTDASSSSSSSSSKRTYKEHDIQAFTKQQLMAVCRQRKWSNYSQFDKLALLEFVERKLCQVGQAMFDNERCIMCRPRKFMNTTDPITCEDISARSDLFMLTVESPASKNQAVRQIFRFDPHAFVTMILTTGDTANPLTREPLSADDMRSLEYAYATVLQPYFAASSTNLGLLQMRPDMRESRLGPCPSRGDLGLEEDEEFPVPASGFAPWLTAEKLEAVAVRVKKRNMSEAAHAQTTAFLTNDVSQAESNLMQFVGDSGSFQRQQLDPAADVCIYLMVPQYTQALCQLGTHDTTPCEELLTRLMFKLDAVVQANDDPTAARLAAWVLACMLDRLCMDMHTMASERNELLRELRSSLPPIDAVIPAHDQDRVRTLRLRTSHVREQVQNMRELRDFVKRQRSMHGSAALMCAQMDQVMRDSRV